MKYESYEIKNMMKYVLELKRLLVILFALMDFFYVFR